VGQPLNPEAKTINAIYDRIRDRPTAKA
jgi:hypothetical protein